MNDAFILAIQEIVQKKILSSRHHYFYRPGYLTNGENNFSF